MTNGSGLVRDIGWCECFFFFFSRSLKLGCKKQHVLGDKFVEFVSYLWSFSLEKSNFHNY